MLKPVGKRNERLAFRRWRTNTDSLQVRTSDESISKKVFLAEWQNRIAFEGERELSSIVRDFQQKKVPVLCSYHLWEGLDIPQDALTRVIIYDLPLPPSDPLFDARRQHATDPFREVDYHSCY